MAVENCGFIYNEIFPFWSKLEDKAKKTICDYTTYVHYKKGDAIHSGDGECTGAVIVKSGCIRVYIMSDEGREITLYRLFPGDMCLLSASCVVQAITFNVFVNAEENSDCYVLNGNKFAELSEQYQEVKIFALELAVERFSNVMWVMQQILFMSMDRRLAIFLCDEAAQTGSDTIRLTNEQIARYIGSAREVVSRVLKYFAADGIAERTKEGVKIIDKQKLRRLAY